MFNDPITKGLKSGWKHQDASRLNDHIHYECDVAVIGTGAGGGIASEILAKSGLSVALIEEGPLKSSTDFKMLESDAYPDLYQESAVRTTKDKSIKILQGKTVGGGTTINWTTSFRTPQLTLDYWNKHFSIQGASEQELLSWFEQIEKKLGISKWSVPPNTNNSLLAKGAKKLGIKTHSINRNVRGCFNLGYCGLGCPTNAKQSMLVTAIPEALKNGAKLFTRTRAKKLIFSDGKAQSLECDALNDNGTHLSGKKVIIHANLFVLSAGAIGSPALLLRSGAPDPYQLIGKRTFLHPVTISGAIMPNKVNADLGAPQTIYSDDFISKSLEEKKASYKLECPPVHPVLLSTVIGAHGMTHRKIMEKMSYLQVIISLQRDGFHPESIGGTVKLKDDLTPTLDYPITKYMWDGFKRSLLTMSEIQFAAGAVKVFPIHRGSQEYSSWNDAKAAIKNFPMKKLYAQLASAHVMGGCAMGENQKQSVVNSNGKHHHINNLYVIDGSIFPTSIGANPMESIATFSQKLSADLAKKMP